MSRQMSLKRPQTASSTDSVILPIPPPIPLEQAHRPPPRPPRPDSGVVREVNAWLDASMNRPSPPLMAGLSYWREGPYTDATETTGVQYAIPIGHQGIERPSTSHSQHLKSFCRRAKKMQVRMPSLRRTSSQRAAVQKKLNRRSMSTPLLAVPYEETRAGSPPAFLTRMGSVSRATTRPATAAASTQTSPTGGWLGLGQGSQLSLPLRRGSPASARFGEPECNLERRINAVFGQAARAGTNLRPATAAAHIPREDSMGSLSDAPTYFSGPPPPSYRSRPASIHSTSSFGCIDGMNPEQRQISQQKAAQRRGMKGKLRRLAQKAYLAK